MKLTNPKAFEQRAGSMLVVGAHFTYHHRGIKQGLENIEWLHSQNGYCLDAPDEMPGGSCFNEVWSVEFKNIGGAQAWQTTVAREEGGRVQQLKGDHHVRND